MGFNFDISLEIIVAFVAVCMSVFSLYMQRRHNILTYKPIPFITKYNYKDRVLVRLWNKGNGPLIIKSLKIKDKDSLIALMPAETRKFTYVEYIDNLRDRVITPGDSLNLLEFKVREDDERYSPEEYLKILGLIKATLNTEIIDLEYKNIYQNVKKFSCDKLRFDNLINEDDSVEEIQNTLDGKKGQAAELGSKQNKAIQWTIRTIKRLRIIR
jgi:hypothetical protein